MKKTRKEALLAGESKYRTGRQCKRGHRAERWTLTGNCTECVLINSKKTYERTREAFRAARKAKAL
jgi:hypothetical protein